MCIKECPHCHKEIIGKHAIYANHVRWCKSNPKRKDLDDGFIFKINKNIDSRLGEFKDFEVTCANCGKKFSVRERENKFPSKKKYYCCRSCANRRQHSNETKEKISKTTKETYQKLMDEGDLYKLNTGTVDISKQKFKEGFHTTWFGEKVYYRSQYELDYFEILDNQKIYYQIESLRIVYYDTILSKRRFCVPDILVDSTIIEIKSSFTYHRQNMMDKVKRYIALGYNVKLILDHKEYVINTPEDLPPQINNITTYDMNYLLKQDI